MKAKEIRMEQKIDVMIDEATVEARIAEIAQQLSKEYEGKTIHIIGVLKGSVFFMCELAKRLTVPVTMDFMSVSSYGNDTKSSGVVKMIKDLDESIEGRDVVLIEDIMDSGRTLSYLINILKERKPASFKVVTLLDKPDRRVVELEPDITGFVIPDRFVVGYGLDCAQKYRNLPYIGVVEFEEENS
jgi:hypoxanthine phosphoribosyltransferase